MSDTPETTASDNALIGDFSPAPSAAPTVSDGQVEPIQETVTEPTTQASDWLSKYNDDQKGFIANKGWESDADMLQSYQNLEKLKGVDGANLFNIKPDMEPEKREEIYQAMGRPATPGEYSIEVGENDIPELADWFKSSAHTNGLSDTAAKTIYGEFNEKMTEIAGAMQAETAAAHAAGLKELSKEWGGAWEQNVNVATRAAEHLGITQEMQEAMKESGMAPQMLKALAKAGSMMTEGQMVGANPDATKSAMGMMTPQEAQSKIDHLTNNAEFKARLYSQDEGTRRKAAEELRPYREALFNK